MRRGQVSDAESIGRLLHDFNTEFNEFIAGPRALAERVRNLLADAEINVGAAGVSLGTGEDDVAARALYESLGFGNRESNGTLNFFYEREL